MTCQKKLKSNCRIFPKQRLLSSLYFIFTSRLQVPSLADISRPNFPKLFCLASVPIHFTFVRIMLFMLSNMLLIYVYTRRVFISKYIS